MRFIKNYQVAVVSGLLLLLTNLITPSVARSERKHDPKNANRPDRFGRIFYLPIFATPTDDLRAALVNLGKGGGILDAKDNLAAGPKELIVNLDLSVGNRNNPNNTAGTTFMGQFLDHDMMFDQSSTLGQPTDPTTVPNIRTPLLDLDTVYGKGPSGSPELYESSDPIKFRVQNGGAFEDLPRNPTTNAAILGDPRNDENLMLAGLHSAFLLFHNNAVNLVRQKNPGISNHEAFLKARRLTTYHYQWMILHEFLPLFVGQPMVDDIMHRGRRFYKPRHGKAFIPVEFQIVFRYGHSIIRPSYRANLAGDNGKPFFGLIFDPAGEGSADPIDLRGGARKPRRFIGWQTFFDFGDGEVKPNKRIDTKISTPLFTLPLSTIVGGTPPKSLPQRTLLRHITWSLPSGQAIARRMHAPVLEPSMLADAGQIRPSFATSTPLWFYILREAELTQDGLRLGAVGGRIVGEVFIGILQSDPNSYLNAQPNFKPTVPTKTGKAKDFRMIDFLTFAGVAPANRKQ